MRPRTRVYTDSNGISELLLCIYGKPEVSSPVPLLIWIPKTYPLEHPLVYIDLESLRDAKVSPGKHVDPSGLISLSLFERWNPQTCNLLQVVEECIKICRYDHVLNLIKQNEGTSLALPPKVPPIGAPGDIKPPLPEKPVIPHLPSSVRSDEGTIANKLQQLDINETKHVAGPPLLPKKPPPPPVFDLLDSTIVSNADSTHTAILNDLQHALNQMSKMDATYIQNNLQSRRLSIESARQQFDSMYENEVKALKDVKESIELTKKSLQAEISALEKQFEAIQAYEKESKELDPFALASGDCAATNQLYKLVAKDYALSDTMHMLARLLTRDTIALDIFVKKTRQLGRDQFFTRMHIQKVIESLK